MMKFSATQGPLYEAIGHEFDDLIDLHRLVIVVVRLIVAALLGGILGYQREIAGKAAGLRTHMLVATGSAFFVLTPQLAGVEDISRVLQGIIAGVGFLGAGAVLKDQERHQIRGLTTAANIWLTAAIGMAVGLGRAGAAFICTVVALLILQFIYRLGQFWERHSKSGRIILSGHEGEPSRADALENDKTDRESH